MTRRRRRSGEQNRADVLDAATTLFYTHGIRAVGVERIAQTAGVAPATLYRAFASKDELVVAYIRERDDVWRTWFNDLVQAADGAGEAIAAVFAAALGRVQSADYRGCPFLMSLSEFPDPQHPAHRAAVENKKWVRDQFTALCDEKNPPSDSSLADQLCVLLDGLYASAQNLGPKGPASTVPPLVRTLLKLPPNA